MMKTVLFLLGLFILGAQVASASSGSSSGWYLGVGIGKTEVEVVGHDRSELVLSILRRDGIPAVSAGGSQDDGDISYVVSEKVWNHVIARNEVTKQSQNSRTKTRLPHPSGSQ